MTLLDRFRTQPQRDPDPAVRLAYLEELPLTEREQIVAAAREDEDPRVRRAAVAKLLDPAALAAILQDETDQSVRDAALTMLRDIALDAFEGVDEAGSLSAVDTLADARTLAQIAKTSLRESVARRAFDRLDPAAPNVMSSIARQAELEPIRQAAFERLHAREDLLSLALHCDFKETASDAVDRLSDRGDLEQVADRAKNKRSEEHTSEILREQDEAAAREAAETQAAEEEQAAQVREQAQRAEAAARFASETVAAEEAAARERETAEQRAHQEAERQQRDAAAQAAADAERDAAAREAERRRINEEAEAKARRDGLSRMNQ